MASRTKESVNAPSRAEELVIVSIRELTTVSSQAREPLTEVGQVEALSAVSNWVE